MPYALLIIREGEYQKAKDFLVAHQKAPGMTPQQRNQAFSELEKQGRIMAVGVEGIKTGLYMLAEDAPLMEAETA